MVWYRLFPTNDVASPSLLARGGVVRTALGSRLGDDHVLRAAAIVELIGAPVIHDLSGAREADLAIGVQEDREGDAIVLAFPNPMPRREAKVARQEPGAGIADVYDDVTRRCTGQLMPLAVDEDLQPGLPGKHGDHASVRMLGREPAACGVEIQPCRGMRVSADGEMRGQKSLRMSQMLFEGNHHVDADWEELSKDAGGLGSSLKEIRPAIPHSVQADEALVLLGRAARMQFFAFSGRTEHAELGPVAAADNLGPAREELGTMRVERVEILLPMSGLREKAEPVLLKLHRNADTAKRPEL